MKKSLLLLLIIGILILAVLPWGVSKFEVRNIVPIELQEEYTNYYAELEIKQQETQEAGRAAKSSINVITIGTIQSNNSSTTLAQSPPLTATLNSLTPVGTVDDAIKTSTPEGGGLPSQRNEAALSTIVIRTAQPNITLTPSEVVKTPIIVVTSQRTLDSNILATSTPTATSAPLLSPTSNPLESSNAIPLPSGLIETEDIITNELFTDQINRTEGSEIFNYLSGYLIPDGFLLTGEAQATAGISHEVEVLGIFKVEKYSLKVEITSVKFGDTLVTNTYRNELESRFDSILYQLLPQKYVTSFELQEGRVQVFSLIRP
jgi:hypothetical protein